MDEMKGNSRAVRILIKIAVFMLLLVLTFFLSYFGVSTWYESHLDKKAEDEKKAQEATAQIQAEETVKNNTFTMMFLNNPDTEQVDYCALRVFNRLNLEMSIFMIPSNSKVELSEELQDTLSEKTDSEVPKEILLSSIGSYYSDNKTKYEMITKVMQHLIGGIKIDSYEALDYETLIKVIDLAEPVTCSLGQMITYTDEMGQTQKLTPGTEHEIDGRKALGILTYSDGFGAGDGGRIERSSSYLMEYVTAMTASYSKKQMSEYLSDYCGMIVTNGKIGDANSYLSDILKLNEENLSFYTMKGTQKEEEYILDQEKIQEDMKILMGEDAFALATTEKEDETAEDKKEEEETDVSESETDSTESTADEQEVSSKDKSITIYNGAYINGLARKWRTKLQEEGYQIEGIYNYSGSTRDNGKIVVREEGMGQDLIEKYFPNAQLEVGVPDDGADIQIILGRSEDF